MAMVTARDPAKYKYNGKVASYMAPKMCDFDKCLVLVRDDLKLLDDGGEIPKS